MAIPQYCDEVLVTLSSVNPPETFPFPSRRIFLTKEKPFMEIGRTSKRNSSLEAAKNNAWFDSAVMSRDHAQLRLDVDKQRVYIKDIGSLHGTFHNDVRLSRNVPCQLKNGDSLRFGIEIDRGADKYPPCVMETQLEFGFASSQDRPKVFRVPDDTDVEDSGSDVEDSIRNSTKIARRIVIPTWSSRKHAMSPTRSPIDLTTGDQYPLSNVRDDQDLASSILPIAPSTIELSEAPKCVDLTTEDEEIENPDQHPDSLGAHWLLGLDRPSEEDAVSQDIQTQASFGDESERSSMHSGSYSGSPAPSSYRNSVFGESDDENMDVDGEEWEDEQEDLEEDEFNEYDEFEGIDGTCERMDTQPEPLDQDGQVEIPDDTFPLFLADIRPEMEDVAQRPEPQEPPKVSAELTDSIERDIRNKLPPLVGHFIELPIPTTPGARIVLPPPYPKLPSIVEATSQPLCSLSHEAPSPVTAQVLGDKTGKHEYFAAREENRLLFRGDSSKGPRGNDTMSLAPCGVRLPEMTPVSIEQPMLSVQERVDYELPACFPTVDEPAPGGLAPVPIEKLQSLTRPSAFDANSAYEFEKMCLEASKTLDAQSKVAEPQIIEPVMPLVAAGSSDQADAVISKEVTIDEALPEVHQTPNSMKRKAAEISQLTPEEEKFTAAVIPTPAKDEARPTFKARLQAPRGRTSTDVSNKLTSLETRPSKRFRRVAEAFGYVALGGVAVMSALIATAPTL